MKQIHKILKIFILLYLSIYKRLKNSDAKSSILSLFAFFIILNYIFNIYFVEFIFKPIVNKYFIFNDWLIINLFILVLLGTILLYVKTHKIINYKFLLKNRKIISNPMFEFIVFIIIVILIVLVNI